MRASHSSIKVMIISLASAVVLLAGLLIGFFAINKEETDQTAGELIPLIACNENEINSLHIESARDTYNIVSDGVKDYIPQWRIEGRDNTDIDQYSVKTVLNRCYKLNARRELGTVDISDSEMMAAYGFDKPTATVTVTTRTASEPLLWVRLTVRIITCMKKERESIMWFPLR